jgi:hypothetical protein
MSAVGYVLCAQSPEVGSRKKLILHDIRTDAQGHIVPWYADDLAPPTTTSSACYGATGSTLSLQQEEASRVRR